MPQLKLRKDTLKANPSLKTARAIRLSGEGRYHRDGDIAVLCDANGGKHYRVTFRDGEAISVAVIYRRGRDFSSSLRYVWIRAHMGDNMSTQTASIIAIARDVLAAIER